MACELCGRECKGCRTAMVDKVKMILCPDCIKYGEGVEEISSSTASVQRIISHRSRKAKPKDIYQGMEKELISNWSEVIQEARRKKGLSREELGFKIGERTVTISKIENGDLRPSDKMIKKLEKELEISLMEDVKQVTTQPRSSGRLTLGDFIKTED